jgi:hypothetical protein
MEKWCDGNLEGGNCAVIASARLRTGLPSAAIVFVAAFTVAAAEYRLAAELIVSLNMFLEVECDEIVAANLFGCCARPENQPQ